MPDVLTDVDRFFFVMVNFGTVISKSVDGPKVSFWISELSYFFRLRDEVKEILGDSMISDAFAGFLWASATFGS